MIAAFSQAAQVLDRPDYAESAARAADFILTRMRDADGKLLRTYSSGSKPKLNAYLEDYSYLMDGLVSLYEATFAPRWLEAALELSASSSTNSGTLPTAVSTTLAATTKH